MSTDEIVERYSDKSVGLRLCLLGPQPDDPTSTILIEGKPDALRMLAELLVSVAEDASNDGFGLSNTGAGASHFANNSDFGVYIHRIDVTGD